MKTEVKNLPKLRLADLLRRRKMTLRQMLDEFGITTFEGLVIRCDRMGVVPPTDPEFREAYPLAPVNSPTEGVVVIEPFNVIDEISGRVIDVEAPVAPGVIVVTEPTPSVDVGHQPPLMEVQKKQPKKKKDLLPGE